MTILLYIILGIALGAGGVYLWFRYVKRLNVHAKCLNEEIQSLSVEKEFLQKETWKLSIELGSLKDSKAEALNTIQSLEQQAKEAGDRFYENQMALASAKIEAAANELSKHYQEAEKEYSNEYKEILEDLTKTVQLQQNNLIFVREQIEMARETLRDEELKAQAVIEANKRNQQEQEQQNFYRLHISETDLLEIEKLKEIIPYLRDPEALNKVIWKIYYEKPYTDLIGRIFGKSTPVGIYKITNVKNGMTYVGQATSVPQRWKQHIKRGIGAETPTKNKLYPAMAEFGVENFTFELLEETTKDKLNEREDFYQDFFGAKEFGYSIK